MTETRTTFTPAPYPLHGVFRQDDGYTFQLLLVGYMTDADGYTEPAFMLDRDLTGDISTADDIGAHLECIEPGFPQGIAS